MKIRNLLLAGLAVAAMTACSNSEDFVDNNSLPEIKDATMQFGIAFPQGGTRAGIDDVNDGKTEVGIADESSFSRVTVVIKYATGNPSVLTYPRKDFTGNGTPDEQKQVLYLKKGIPVTAGIAAEIYAFINPSDALIKSLEGYSAIGDLQVTGNYSTNSLDALIAKGGIAAAGNFLMSGVAPQSYTFTAGTSEQKVQVPVNRVAAKLVERSQANAFTVKDDKISTEAPELKIQLKEYRFVNLQQDTYVLSNKTVSDKFFEAYLPAASWSDYAANAKPITGPTAAEATNNITYCTENPSKTHTNILYKAVATWGGNEASTFYVSTDGKVYLTFEALAAEIKVDGLTANSSIADFAKAGIKKYENGECYYKSDDIGTIVRNNVYYLNVTGISHLGEPTSGDPAELTSIKLEVAINPWTIHVIGIQL